MRKAVMILLALAAIRLLPRTLRREARALELFTVLFQMAAMATANTSKAYSTEKRVGTVEGKVGTMQSQRGTFAGFSGSNSSFPMAGGTVIGYNPQGSGNNGGDSSQTSGQIGGASAHYHSMTHYHTSSTDLQNVFNALQSSFADVDGRLNTMYAKLTAAGIL